ncbi:MAG TPA: hypothetical protein PL045_00265 [Chitinophagaceae bacterium]|nr:hypothetical protein [Chitinophagaceae bacterium]
MKAFGIILIVAGILMLIFTNINFTTEKKVVDAGPIEINKKENKSIGWPSWAGAVAIIAGAGMVIADKRKS